MYLLIEVTNCDHFEVVTLCDYFTVCILQTGICVFNKVFCKIRASQVTKPKVVAIFPFLLISDDTTPVFKKEDETDKANERPIGVLLSISKIFEKICFTQIEKLMNNKPSCLLFRIRQNTQNILFNLLQNYHENLDARN